MDVDKVADMSEAIRAADAAALQEALNHVAVREKELVKKPAASLNALAYTEIDRRRAGAVIAAEAWEERVHKRSNHVLNMAENALAAIASAEQSLVEQRDFLVGLQGSHARA